jgi:hypothetical protein
VVQTPVPYHESTTPALSTRRKPLTATMSGANNSIKVVARFRPQNKVELESGGQPIVTFDAEDTCSLDVRAPSLNHDIMSP